MRYVIRRAIWSKEKMLLPIFIFGLIVYFCVVAVIIRMTKPESRKKIWNWVIAGTVLVCAADHLAGYLYARTWVTMTQGDITKTIQSDSVVLEYKNIPSQDETSDSAYWINPFVDMVTHGYSKIQLIRHRPDIAADAKETFELSLVGSDEKSQCSAFRELSSATKKTLLEKAGKIVINGSSARCISISAVEANNADFLVRHVANELPYKNVFGISSSFRVSAIDLKTRQVVSEYRSADFAGGWVKRTFWTGLDSGRTDTAYFRSSPFGKSDWPERARWFEELYRPSNPQHLTK